MIDLKTIMTTAKLARLKVSSAEAENLTQNFEKIMNYFDQINSLDVQGVLPLYTPFEVLTELRTDKASQTTSPVEILETAPSLRDSEYMVPPVVS